MKCHLPSIREFSAVQWRSTHHRTRHRCLPISTCHHRHATVPPLHRSPHKMKNTRGICSGASASVQEAISRSETETEPYFTLPDGYRMELLHEPCQESTQRPPLLFVHGSFHAAWCWQEHFMPFFAAAGYDCYAVSLRGQGRSERTAGMQAGSLTQHVTDLGHVVASLPRLPVMIGHSFGGLVVQRYVCGSSKPDAQLEQLPELAGIALLCSAPGSGNDALVQRIARKSLVNAAKLTWAMVTKNFLKSAAACRELFFSGDLPQELLERYQGLLKEHASAVSVINVARMREEVPLPGPPSSRPRAFVLGAERDLLVDVPAVLETAEVYGVEPVLLEGCAHDAMLDTRWQAAAEALKSWLDGL